MYVPAGTPGSGSSSPSSRSLFSVSMGRSSPCLLGRGHRVLDQVEGRQPNWRQQLTLPPRRWRPPIVPHGSRHKLLEQRAASCATVPPTAGLEPELLDWLYVERRRTRSASGLWEFGRNGPRGVK